MHWKDRSSAAEEKNYNEDNECRMKALISSLNEWILQLNEGKEYSLIC